MFTSVMTAWAVTVEQDCADLPGAIIDSATWTPWLGLFWLLFQVPAAAAVKHFFSLDHFLLAEPSLPAEGACTFHNSNQPVLAASRPIAPYNSYLPSTYDYCSPQHGLKRCPAAAHLSQHHLHSFNAAPKQTPSGLFSKEEWQQCKPGSVAATLHAPIKTAAAAQATTAAAAASAASTPTSCSSNSRHTGAAHSSSPPRRCLRLNPPH